MPSNAPDPISSVWGRLDQILTKPRANGVWSRAQEISFLEELAASADDADLASLARDRLAALARPH